MIEKLTIDSLDLRPKLILAFVLVAALVAVTGEEQTASLSGVSESVQDLSALSETLHDQVSMFETRDSVTAGASLASEDEGGSPARAQADGGHTPAGETTTSREGGR